MPGAVRPARPARWIADALDTGTTWSDSMPVRALNEFCLQKPVSTTYTMPSIVSDVSAMFVARMTLRPSGGAASKMRACASAGSVE